MFSFNSLLDPGFINYWDRLWNPVTPGFRGGKGTEKGVGVAGGTHAGLVLRKSCWLPHLPKPCKKSSLPIGLVRWLPEHAAVMGRH